MDDVILKQKKNEQKPKVLWNWNMSILFQRQKTFKKTFLEHEFYDKFLAEGFGVKWFEETEKQKQKTKKWENINSFNFEGYFSEEKEKFKRREEEFRRSFRT